MTPLALIRRLFSLGNLPLMLVLLLLSTSILITPFQFEQPVYNLQVSFDISQSMNAEDMTFDQQPVSRLIMAKAAARQLLLDLPCGSRVGWSIFAGFRSITLLTPLDVCQHYAGLLASLDKIDGRMRWVNASSVGKGLHQAMRATQVIGENTGIVFISDGHEAPPLRLGQRGMPNTDRLTIGGLIVGVGGETPVRIPKTDREERRIGFWQASDVVQLSHQSAGQSREQLSSLHGEHLIQLAQLARLQYVSLDSKGVIAEALRASNISQLKSVPLDLRWIPAALALLILSLRLIWSVFTPRFGID